MTPGVSLEPFPPPKPGAAAPADRPAAGFEEHLRAEPPLRRSPAVGQSANDGAEQSTERALNNAPPATQGGDPISDRRDGSNAASDDEPRKGEDDAQKSVDGAPAAAIELINQNDPAATPNGQNVGESTGGEGANDATPRLGAAPPAASPTEGAAGRTRLPFGAALNEEESLGEVAAASPPQPASHATGLRAAVRNATPRPDSPQAPSARAESQPPANATGEPAASDASKRALRGLEEASRRGAAKTDTPETAASAPAHDGEPATAAPEASHETRETADKPATSSSETRREAPSLSAADRVRFVQRVAGAIEAARPDGEIRLRLRPPELGSLYLRVRTEEGALAAQFETESPQARALLSEHLGELRQRLAELNIRVERLDVEWRGAGSDTHAQSFGRQGGSSGNRDSNFGQRTGQNRHETQEPTIGVIRPVRPHRGDLDVVV